jgi:hypothetical protein
MRAIIFGAEKYSVCPLCTQEVQSDVFQDVLSVGHSCPPIIIAHKAVAQLHRPAPLRIGNERDAQKKMPVLHADIVEITAFKRLKWQQSLRSRSLSFQQETRK